MNTESFYYYLKDKGLAARTIEENVKDIRQLNAWLLKEKSIHISQLHYNDLLNYVQYLKTRSLAVATINIRINSLRKYYEHLKEEKIIERNPAKHLRIKGALQGVTENPLSYTELETLYGQYALHIKGKSYQARNLVILGLMKGQGLHTGELDKMQISHVDLEEGRIYIPGTRRSNGRTLKLEVKQILILHSYLNSLPGGQQKLVEGSMRNHLHRLLKELRGINPSIKNLQHIRASVILQWIKIYDLRTVQSMAGHRYISTTQDYEVEDLNSLTDMLTRHHPFA